MPTPEQQDMQINKQSDAINTYSFYKFVQKDNCLIVIGCC